ncbi:MFS transporter [Salinisphaera sp. USBA-960]|uniref:MFS transporter n=1 Tax=Salinisphaera orenii TaxID=856731 RepID=UPI000DBE6E0C|nr:MFS transporter [Salifodinibacter halophilus]NNC25475.1 MFS transporter [Salifodinibacter halophilus]
MTRAWRWAFYDWANSAFATVVIAAFFPVFFKTVAAADLASSEATFWLGLGNAAASLIVFIAAPVLGGVVDYAGRKQAGLITATTVSVIATAALFWVGAGQWPLALTCFIVALAGFFAAMVCYDSLLTDVSESADYARVSARGYALGYLGGGLLLTFDVVLVSAPQWFGLSGPSAAIRWSFVSVALWWLVFSLPLWLGVRECRPASPFDLRRAARQSVLDLSDTTRAIVTQPVIWRFLAAYWLYIDAIHTIVRMAVDFGLNLGLARQDLVMAILLAQFVGFPASLFFGWLAMHWRLRASIFIGLGVYAAMSIWSYFLVAAWQFYVMAVCIGLVQGGVQALSRAYFAAIIPAAQSGRYFGVYNMLGKFSAIIGPVLVGVTTMLTGNVRFSIVSVSILLVAGAIFLATSRDPKQAHRATETVKRSG